MNAQLDARDMRALAITGPRSPAVCAPTTEAPDPCWDPGERELAGCPGGSGANLSPGDMGVDF